MENTKTEWKWWAGDNEELYGVGPCDSREQAISEAIADGICEKLSGEHHICLIEATCGPIRIADWVSGDELVDHANEGLEHSDIFNSDCDPEPPIFEPTPDQVKDLSDRIKKALNEWQDHHKIVVVTNTFTSSRNREFIIAIHDEKTNTTTIKPEE